MQVKNICGRVIAKLRSQANPPVTQESLVAKLQVNGLDLDRASLAKIETQKRRVYDYEVVAIAKALNTNPADLLVDE